MRRYIRLALVAFCLLSANGVALAQTDEDEAVFAAGPKTLALIIGNADYDANGEVESGRQPPAGYLTDLRSPCDDAKLIHRSLVKAGWEPDTGKPNSATVLRCDLSPAEINALAFEFWKKASQAKGAKIVFYFSGHGAEVAGHKYLFGVGEPIDLEAARQKLSTTSSDVDVFQSNAFDLRDLLIKLGEQTDNGVLIIIDACRNDPIYTTLNAWTGVRIASPSVSPDEYDGIIVTYATRAGNFAFTPPGRRYSVYSQELSQFIQRGPKFGDVVDYANSRTADVTRKWATPQKPIRYGSMHQPPPWCMGECSQKEPVREPIDVDDDLPAPSSPSADMTESNLTLAPSSFEVASGVWRLGLAKAVWSPVVDRRQLITRTQAIGGILSTASQTPFGAAQAQTRQGPKVFFEGSPRGFTKSQIPSSQQPGQSQLPVMNGFGAGTQFDIYWCSGGTASAELEREASELAASLSETAARAAAEPGDQAVLGVRTRPLDPNANSRQTFRFTSNVVVYDAADKNETEWAQRISALQPSATAVASNSRTPRYIPVYFCKDPAPRSPRTRVFAHVPDAKLRPSAQALRDDIKNLLADTADGPDVQVISDKVPNESDIRYYHLEDRDAVFKAADVVSQRLQHAVNIFFLSEYTGSTEPGRMEIWIGKNEVGFAAMPANSVVWRRGRAFGDKDLQHAE